MRHLKPLAVAMVFSAAALLIVNGCVQWAQVTVR